MNYSLWIVRLLSLWWWKWISGEFLLLCVPLPGTVLGFSDLRVTAACDTALDIFFFN